MLNRSPRHARGSQPEPPSHSRPHRRKEGRGRTLVAATALGALLAAGLAQVPAAQAAPSDVQAVTVTAADVAAAAESVNALTFKGFGILSANSTSALLLDYKSQHPEKYWELIETLFGGEHPIMTTIKIEMGNDRNTSTGPNVATMRSRDEYPNVQREPDFQLAADAQKVAEGDVHVSILRWSRPTWVTSDEDQYIWFKNTVLAAEREYGIMVDSINPDTNETTSPNAALYKKFSTWLRTDTKGYEGASAQDPSNGFASADEGERYRAIRTVAADTVGTPPTSFGDQLNSATDPSLRDAVDVVGFHYATSDDANGNLKRFAQTYDKEIWNSEGQATFSNSADRPNNTNPDGQGGTGTEFGGTNSALEMSNWVTSGFAKSLRTLNIFQPAIGSFYDGFQYSSKELVSARDPWSGWLYYDGGLAAVEQYTQFAQLGWENEDNTAGVWRGIPQASGSALGGGNPPSGASTGAVSYTTLAAPDGSDFSTVIVNDSPFEKTYAISAKDLDLGDDRTMEVWETRAADAGEAYDANYVVPVSELSAVDGVYTVTVKPWSTATATTLDHAASAGGVLTPREGYGSTLPTSPEYTDADGGRDVLDTDASGDVNGVTTDSVLYADDFDYTEAADIRSYDPATGALSDSGESFLDSRGAKAKPAGTPAVQPEDDGAIPRYTNDTNGAFESVATGDAARDRVLRQQVGPGMNGSAWNGGDPKTTIGDYRWANYRASVDVLFENGGTPYATLGAREQGGTPNGQNVSAAELRVDATGAWSLLRYGTSVASGTASATPGTAFRTGTGVWNRIAVQVAGDRYTAYLNGVQVAAYTDPAPQAAGRVQLGSAFTFTQFDDLVVEQVPGFTPYYSTVVDGMHQTSWSDGSTPILEFDEQWTHVNGQGMFEWQRTASKSTGKGAALSYSFTGTGLDVLGSNTGAATLNVTVDGVRVATNAPTWAAGSERTAFQLRGLADGAHTVVLETANDGVLNVDAVGVVVANADSSAVDTTALAAALATAERFVEAEWSASSWAPFASVVGSARSALADPAGYGLDAEGAAALVARLSRTAAELVPEGVSTDVRDLGLIAGTASAGLPKTLTLEGAERAVTWDAGAAQALAGTAELGTVRLTGRTTEKVASTGVFQRFSVPLLVTPADLRYFVDSGSSGSAAGSAYAAVKASQPGVLNDAADRKWDGVSAGSTWGYSTTSTGAVVPGNPADWSSSYVPADFGKPVVTHLTLPAGTYDVVAVQAPRAGLTTNVVSTVTAAGTTKRATAVSTGAATPVRQQVTLATPGVVDVSFGTDGTSGYNARLALVYVQSVTRDLGYQGALTASAALPTTVTVDGASTGVTWDADSAAQTRTDYAPVTLRGTLANGAKVTARYEVVPEGLVYYIDSGTAATSSPQYGAVQAAVPSLLNAVSDRASTAADQWGFAPEGMKVKTGTDVNDKFSTGLYQDTTQLIYRLPLAAGTYTLTGGFTEWWNLSRTMNHTVSAGGVELAKGNIPLSGTNTPLTGALTFTLAAPTTVEYRVTNEGAGGEKPVISWLGVAAVAPAAPALPDLDVTVQSRCVAGKVQLGVTAVNTADVPVGITMTTAYGEKAFTAVAPGKSVFHSFTTRAKAVPADAVDLTVTGTVDGEDVTREQSEEYPAASC
ncbi:hypothetical protein EDF54_3162 [Rathayibacter sp. PhB93]|uniref:hypothetical protein n=1 Tax=unclassified Rathayibacter TaxID=2609250 RepID=UPI000F494C44|nr:MULTISPECIES: hypothetical protein [unclassified Rathayibacter]ROQ03686.1 hypothetical protein EDF54_3162 [Rathayibacter sp. PhB93]TDQ10710.1 hypothetical protein EDF17_2950 [Rathayibacter sp. PhB1]